MTVTCAEGWLDSCGMATKLKQQKQHLTTTFQEREAFMLSSLDRRGSETGQAAWHGAAHTRSTYSTPPI